MTPIWCVLPHRNNVGLTLNALADLLDQTVPTRVLLIGQGVSTETREALEREAALQPLRVANWFYDPPLTSLSAVWNTGLQYCWTTGADRALVVNNDVRLPRHLVATLSRAMDAVPLDFVSAVGRPPADWDPARLPPTDFTQRGGPDFSCFLIRARLHQGDPFDEQFQPAFCEDVDYHRRLLLTGRGPQIASIDLPYLHFGSQTLQGLPDEERRRLEAQITQGSRAYYAQKWGGPVNAETYWRPFDPESASGDGRATTPALQAEAADAALL